MKLIDKVKELNQDELVYIGSKSAFIFIGTPTEFLEQHEELSLRIFKRFKVFKKNTENAIKYHEKSKPNPNTVVKQKIQDIKTRRIKEVDVPYDSLLKKWEERRDNLIKTYNATENNIGRFVPLERRIVKEQYPRIDNPNSTVLIITGNEVGISWTKKDYDERGLMSDHKEVKNDKTTISEC